MLRNSVMALVTVLYAVALCIGTVHCRPAGPVILGNNICTTLIPGGPHSPRSGNGGYTISTSLPFNTAMALYEYTAGQSYTVTIQAESITFRGFMVQTRDPSDAPIGTFSALDSNQQQVLDCSANSVPAGTTIGHTNSARLDFTSQMFSWTAPSGATGFVNFMFTIVRTQPSYYGPLNAAQMEAAAATTQAPGVSTQAPGGSTQAPGVSTQAPEGSTQAPGGSTQAPGGSTQAPGGSTQAPGGSTQPPTLPPALTTPMRSATDYRIILRSPEDCEPSACAIFVGIDTNAGDSAYLDVYMEANATAWVAVGFSETPTMFAADVLGCNIESGSSAVTAVDTWNPPNTRTNTLDAIQDVYLFSGALTNGRIACTLARKTAGSNVPNADLNLDGNYWIIYGWGLFKQAGGALGVHSVTPMLSEGMMNPAGSSDVIISATSFTLALFAAIAVFVNVE